MKTITVQIGNSDDRLTQSQWKDYVNQVHELILVWGGEIHFSAPSVGWADWQNACWVFTMPTKSYKALRLRLKSIRVKYKQDSLAFTVGDTEFV
jgi:hypothetical protein